MIMKYPARYAMLADRAELGLDNTQCYVLPNFMVQDYFPGYADMYTCDSLIFPRDHMTQLDFQFGWYFWSGNYLDTSGNEVDIVIVFFRRALYPPPIAEKLGFTPIGNQVVQTVVAVNYADKNLHVTGSNSIVTGKGGQIIYGIEPFVAKIGNNSAQSLQKEAIFPMKITVNDPEKGLSIDLDLLESKPLFLQGDRGRIPSIFGLGMWYYSFTNIRTEGTVTYQGETRSISGKTWMDHQWLAGISPTGYPKNILVQAIANIKEGLSGQPPQSFGWDWSDVQFDDNTEVTFSSPHSVWLYLGLQTMPPTAGCWFPVLPAPGSSSRASLSWHHRWPWSHCLCWGSFSWSEGESRVEVCEKSALQNSYGNPLMGDSKGVLEYVIEDSTEYKKALRIFIGSMKEVVLRYNEFQKEMGEIHLSGIIFEYIPGDFSVQQVDIMADMIRE